MSDYTPSIYVSGSDTFPDDIRAHVEELPSVRRTAVESWRRGFRHDAEPLLRVDVASIEAVRTVAQTISNWGDPGTHRLYNVDFTREFRYCLENDLTPVPSRSLRTVELAATDRELTEEPLATLDIDGTTVHGA